MVSGVALRSGACVVGGIEKCVHEIGSGLAANILIGPESVCVAREKYGGATDAVGGCLDAFPPRAGGGQDRDDRHEDY